MYGIKAALKHQHSRRAARNHVNPVTLCKCLAWEIRVFRQDSAWDKTLRLSDDMEMLLLLLLNLLNTQGGGQKYAVLAA
jgi:hypothetical protein